MGGVARAESTEVRPEDDGSELASAENEDGMPKSRFSRGGPEDL
jgi:hypothetical protein